MIKKTLYFGNPVYLSLRNAQLVIKLPDVEKATALPEVLKKAGGSDKTYRRHWHCSFWITSKSPSLPVCWRLCLKTLAL